MAMSSSGTSRPASRLTATRPPSVVMHSQVDLTDEFVPIPLLVELRPNSGTPIVAVAGSVGMGEFEPKSTSGRGASRKGNQAPTPSDGTTRPASRALNFANRQSGPDQDLGAESHRRDDSDDDYDENQPIEGDMGPEGNLESTFMPPGERLDSASSHPSSAGTAAFAVGGGGTTKKKPGAPPGSGGAAAAGAASVAAPPSLVLPITIPHGFQLQRSLLHGKAAVRSVLFTASLALETKSPTSTTMVSHAPTPATGHNAPSAYSAVNAFSNPNADTFASLDAHFVHLWRGTSRVRKRGLGPSIDLTREAREPIAAGGGGLGGLTEPVAQWCYIRKHRLYVVATDRLELKILDHNLLELSRRASEKAVLTLEVIEDEIIVGCVGGVWIYPIHREPESVANHSVYVLLNPRLVLRNLGEDEWVGKIMFRASMRRLYVACDVTINIFDYDSGERVDSLTNLHELAITALTIHEPTELLITGCKDGSIKVWNSQRLLLMAFHDHAGAISSLLLPLSLSSLQRPPPILLSGSLDGSLRMWDLDKGRCVYRQPTQQRVLGMGMMRRDVFFHYSPRAIYVWHLNRLISSFTGTQSPITHIMRVMAPAPVLRPSSSPGGTTLSPTKRGEMGRRARLVIACEDGSVRLVSPRTGQVLATCFPTFKQISILDIAHDILQERAYTLMSSGEIISFDTSVNPARVVATLDGRAAGSDMGRLTCMVALSEPQPLENTFTVLGGTSVGQIVQVDLASGRHSMLVQGHTATVISIQALPAQTADGCAWVVTCALDRSVKTWKWYPEGALEPVHAITCTGVPRRLKGAPPVTLKGIDAASGSMSVNVAWPTVYMLASSQGPLSVHETLPTGALSGLAGKSLLQGSPSASHSSLPNLASVVVPGPHAPGRVWLHSPDEDHTSSVTAVDFLPALGMFLTSGTDGVVKVWSVENTLLREIQVGEPVTSVAFANARGDLLIGVHDEVSVVRWRDYMPASMCNIMQDLVLPEDPLEDPMPFDSGLDFWNGFHGQPGFDNSQWQLCMYNVRPEDGFFDSELMKELERAINRSPMMSKSKQSYGASRFDINDRRNDGSVFPRIESDGDRRVSTRSEATYGGLLGIPSSTSQDGLDQGKSALDDELDAMLADMSKKTYAALAAAEMDADGVWDALDAMLQNEGSAAHSNLKYVTSRAPKPLPKMSTPVEEPAAPEVDASLAIQQYRDSHRIGEIDDKVKVLKANIVAAGAAGKSIMPNSIARGRNGGEDDDDERNRMSSRHRTGTSGSGMSQKKGSKSSHSIKHARRRKEKPAPPPKPEPDQYDYERDHSAFADDDDDLDDDLDDDPFAALAAAAAAKPQSAAPVPVPEHKDPPSKPAAHHRPPPPPRLPTPPPPPPPPKVPTPPPSPPPPPPPPKAISPVSDDTKSPPPVTPAPSSPVKYVTPKPPKPKPLPPPPPPKRPPINLMQSSKPSHEPPKTIFKAKPLPASTRVPTTPLRPKTPVVRPPAKVVLREAAEEEKAVWSVLRQQQVHFEPPVAPVGAANGGTGGAAGSGEPTSLTNNLKRVTSMAWFPGLGGQTVTVTNVLGVLGDLIRGTHNHPAAGYVGTRVEAVKMAAYVYQVFSRDIQNPAGTVVAPLVEAMHTDTEWAVRAQVAAIVPKLGVYHPELIVGLITRLADVHPMVRRAAMSSLAHFGIMTRETLEAAMTRVSLLPPKPVAAVKKKKDAFRSVLDDLYDDYCRENEIKRQASAVMVQGWLRNSTFRYSDRLAAED